VTRTPLLRSKGQRSTYWGWGILWRASHRAMFTFDWQPSICTPVGYCQQGRSETSKGQMSRSPGRFTNRGVNASGSCSSDRCNVLTVGTYCYVAVCRQARSPRLRQALRRPQREERGGGMLWQRPAYSLFVYNMSQTNVPPPPINFHSKIVADKPCDAFVQMQRVADLKHAAPLHCVLPRQIW